MGEQQEFVLLLKISHPVTALSAAGVSSQLVQVTRHSCAGSGPITRA